MSPVAVAAQQVNWISWDQAVATVQGGSNDKKIFIDVYTDWCGWCKRMDKDTFQNPEVAAYMNENFLMVKLDGEQKEPIEYNGKTYKFVPSGRKGYHELAAALLQGRLSYPTVVFLDEELNMLSPVPGYQKPDAFLQIARYFGDNIYKEKDWQTYSGTR
ncbi:SoxW precursor, putative [Robiginitalea biformata HTCC2501]|uniref:SoxW, putative n=2 Tax=Flavobacteriaceae TaxID=49546 RepID=A4CMM9_ROBBH|nr:SoxW precursor, putative [Robiginitalea biformata HTCC2501]